MGLVTRAIHHYRDDMRLSSKLLISHLAVILASTITMVSFFVSSIYDVLITTTINAKQQTAFATAASVEVQLNKLTDHAESIVSAFYRFASGRLGQAGPARTEFTEEYLIEAIEAMDEPELETHYQIYLSPGYADLLEIPALAPYVQADAAVYGTYWYGIFSAAPEQQSLFCPSLYLSPQEIESYGDLAYVAAMPGILDQNVIGYVAIYFSQEPIIDALAQNLSVSRGASYIINSRDALVCDSASDLVGAYYINNDQVDRIVSEGGSATYLGDEIIVGSYPVSRTDWKVVSVLPKTEALRDADRAVAKFFSIYGAVAVLSVLFSIVLARSISGRIASVVHKMGLVRDTRPEQITSLPPAKDEVGQLVASYNSMVQALNGLMDKESEAAKTLRLSEFKALQAQINPHFLYNSLDMINWLALAGEQEKTCEAVQSLARFYKLTLSRRDTFGTVRKETEHATLYVKLQNMRYEDRIQFSVDIDENIQDCVMPKLVFQPLVENAILHGVMEREDKTGEVLLAGWRDGADLLFLIFDNGVGMTAQQLEALMHPEPTAAAGRNQNGSHIGVYNTHERLQLYYGPQYGLEYKSTPGQGTEVLIRIPFSVDI